MRLFHYTYGLRINDILSSGRIERVGFSGTYTVTPPEKVVWFSADPHWEMTVRKTFANCDLTFTELTGIYGAYRIGIDRMPELVQWRDYVARFPQLKTLAKMGKQWGANPNDWFISANPVSRDLWQNVQKYVDNRWTDYVPAENARAA
jgi:hypothetical protein